MAAEHGARTPLNGAPEGPPGARPAEAARMPPGSEISGAGEDITEWIKITDPQTQKAFYANPVTGECQWNEPENETVRQEDPAGEWWELYDEQHKLPYYYNTLSGQSEWSRPTTGTVIPLSAIQSSALGKRASVAFKRGSIPFEQMNSAAESSKFAGGNNASQPNLHSHSVDPNQPLQHQIHTRSAANGVTGSSRTLAYSDQPGGVAGPAGLQATPSSVGAVANVDPRTQATSAVTTPLRFASSMNTSSAPDPGGMRLEHARKSISTAEAARNAGISEPVINREAALRMSPVRQGEHGPGDGTTPDTIRRPLSGISCRNSVVSSSSLKSLPPELQNDINQFQINGYAQKYFCTHKQGIFRRKVPVEKMLNWTKDSLKQPLIVLNKSVHKDALKCFKNMQRVMGDRHRKSNKDKAATDEIQWILDRGIRHGELRDEIYVQLCKQLTKNTNDTSVRNGWELMCVILMTFPPSKNFENYLLNFLQQHGPPLSGESVGQLAKYAVTRLRRICKVGPRGKVPTAAEIERGREAAFKPSVFGESLEDIMHAQRQEFPDLYLPRVLPFLSEAILKLGGQRTEGIFRVPGDADEVTELKVRLENGKYDLGRIQDPNVPASLLKFWLRDLAEPLIPEKLYSDCLKCADDVPRALAIIDQLPETNRRVAHYVINLLQLFAKPEEISFTKMNVSNLGMVMAPNFLRCPSENLTLVFENTKYEQAFMRTLIVHLRADPLDMRL